MTKEFNFDECLARPDCLDCLGVDLPTGGATDIMDELCPRHRKNREVRAANQKRIEDSLRRFDELVNSI